LDGSDYGGRQRIVETKGMKKRGKKKKRALRGTGKVGTIPKNSGYRPAGNDAGRKTPRVATQGAVERPLGVSRRDPGVKI